MTVLPRTALQAGADECIDMAQHKPEQLKGLLRQAASQGAAAEVLGTGGCCLLACVAATRLQV
jgi:hypothetical protein